MSGPLLVFAEHMLLVTILGLVLGLGLLGAAVRWFRRRRWLSVLLAVFGAALAGGTIFILSQIGPALVEQASMVGRPAPPFEVSRVADGRKVSLAELEGQVVVVNFWATWCPPCRAEMAELDRLQVELRDRGLVVLNVSDEAPETIRKFLDTQPMSTLHGYAEPLPWPEFGRPTTFVVDRAGVLRKVVQGPRTHQQFLDLVSPWL